MHSLAAAAKPTVPHGSSWPVGSIRAAHELHARTGRSSPSALAPATPAGVAFPGYRSINDNFPGELADGNVRWVVTGVVPGRNGKTSAASRSR
jgi:hypothetical protein